MQSGQKKVLAVLEDLFFTIKIADAAKRAGMEVEFVKTEEAALEKAAGKPPLIIVDLNCSSVDVLGLIRKVKAATETKDVKLIGYVSHVQAELKQKAQEAGCDMVMARSAFSQNLHQLFRRHAGGS